MIRGLKRFVLFIVTVPLILGYLHTELRLNCRAALITLSERKISDV